MKSPEKMGESPEQPKEEPVTDKKKEEILETSEKPTSPEFHNERELNVSISKDATFAELFSAIDATEKKKGLGELHFEEELWDNFDPEVVEEILSFRDIQASKAVTTKLVDFFKEHGYTKKDLLVYLPIKFKRERKKK